MLSDLGIIQVTLLQAAGLALLWMVKSFPDTALLFPFFIVLMIPFRFLFKYIFTEAELNAVSSSEYFKHPCSIVKLIPLLCSWMVPMQDPWSLLIPMKVKAISTGDLSIIHIVGKGKYGKSTSCSCCLSKNKPEVFFPLMKADLWMFLCRAAASCPTCPKSMRKKSSDLPDSYSL